MSATGVPHLDRACELLWQHGHQAIAEALEREVRAALAEAQRERAAENDLIAAVEWQRECDHPGVADSAEDHVLLVEAMDEVYEKLDALAAVRVPAAPEPGYPCGCKRFNHEPDCSLAAASSVSPEGASQ